MSKVRKGKTFCEISFGAVYLGDALVFLPQGVVMVHRGKSMTSSAQDLDPVPSVTATNANDTTTVSVTFPRYKYYEEKADSVKVFNLLLGSVFQSIGGVLRNHICPYNFHMKWHFKQRRRQTESI